MLKIEGNQTNQPNKSKKAKLTIVFVYILIITVATLFLINPNITKASTQIAFNLEIKPIPHQVEKYKSQFGYQSQSKREVYINQKQGIIVGIIQFGRQF